MLLNLKKQYFHEFIAKIWQYVSQISSIPVNTQEKCAKTQAIPKKLKQIPKKLKDFPKKLKVPEDFPYLILQKSVIKKPGR